MPPPNALTPWNPLLNQSADWAKRADGSQKGMGFLGALQRPDGNVSSEISIPLWEEGGHELPDGSWGGSDYKKGPEIPTLVPTLTKEETMLLLSAENPAEADPKMWRSITNKAVAFAKQRAAQGKPYFADPTEQNTRIHPDLPRWAYPDRPVPSHASTMRDIGALLKR